jgi:glycosyltransferase involved in cell wall biosynthesis
MKALTCCIPGPGGVCTALLTLRRALAPYGVTVNWFEAGRTVASHARQFASPGQADEVALLATGTDDEKARARALLDYVEHERPDFFLANVLGGALEANLVRYLPREMPRILIVHSISRSTYMAARAIRDWVDAAVAISPRIQRDLVQRQGFSPSRVHLIPNSVEADTAPREAGVAPLRVLFHGRIEHSSKGVNWIPEIAGAALDAGVPLSLTIAGDGPDLAQLRDRLSSRGLADRVEVLGFVPCDRVPGLMRSHDVLLFPSIFEGLGISLLEAMAGGCVPVASRISGVTDYVIADGQTGLLFPVGDTRAAAARLVELERDRSRLRAMSDAARQAVRSRFSIESQGAAFHRLIDRVVLSPRKLRAPLAIEDWRMPRRLRPGWWHSLPAPLKNTLRLAHERLQTASAR